jgi:putative oxygen-independent coproporphyrinogen III oxidase
MSRKSPPLSLYVHLPWCVRKCPYCDFNSHTAGASAPRDRYVKALSNDLLIEASRVGCRSVGSIFLGGGTPSLFAAEEISAVLKSCRGCLNLVDDCEITMEANPGTLERGRLVAYRQAGITRLSIGAQSFDAEMLSVLGRIHGPDDIQEAFREARKAGFASINIDLMFALPGQGLAAAITDVESLIRLAPDHISYYQLTLEPNTVFYQRPPEGLPDDDLAWEIQERCHGLLAEAGYDKYEISAFARAGHQCRHNLNYWTFGDYLAVGAGAHGKLTDPDGASWRYQKPSNPLVYIEWAEERLPRVQLERIEIRDLGFEFMLNALRLSSGFSAADLSDRTGLDIRSIQAKLDEARAEGLIDRADDGIWRPSETGNRFLNDLQARFLP